MTTSSSGTLTTTPGVAQTIGPHTMQGAYVLRLDLSALAAGDTLVVQATASVRGGAEAAASSPVTYTGVQAVPVVQRDPLVIAQGDRCRWIVTHTGATPREVPYTVSRA